MLKREEKFRKTVQELTEHFRELRKRGDQIQAELVALLTELESREEDWDAETYAALNHPN